MCSLSPLADPGKLTGGGRFTSSPVSVTVFKLTGLLQYFHCDTDHWQSRIVYLVRLISIWYCKWFMLWFMLPMTLDMPDEGTR